MFDSVSRKQDKVFGLLIQCNCNVGNGVPASGCDTTPLSYLIYSGLFMPPFHEGGAELEISRGDIFKILKILIRFFENSLVI